jgi:hypothetical protein
MILKLKILKTMKKIKLFALAALLLGSTSASAQGIYSDGDWKYTGVNPAAKTATLVSLVDSKKGTVEDLKIPATVADEGGTKYTITAIAADAFKDDEAIKTVTFTTTVTSIGDNAFDGASNLTTVTFPTGSQLTTIGDGAFANTFALEKLDLSNTKVYAFSGTPFVSGSSSNVALEELVLPAKTYQIGTALAKLRALKKVNIKDTKIRSIGASAFAGDKNFTTLVLPAVYKYDEDTGEQLTTPETSTLAANALKDSYIATLTINGNLVSGTSEGINALGATTLTTVTFNGSVGAGAIKTGAFVGNVKLATVTFNGDVASNAIADQSFTDCATTDDGAKKLTFTIAAGKATAVVFAGTNAFTPASVTAQLPAAKCNVAISAPDAAVGTVPFRATFTPTVPPATRVKVYGTSTYYGKFMNTGTTPVNIKREVATVYSAYVDGSKIYMDPVQVIDGNQIIAGKQNVIVKTSSPKTDDTDGSKYIELAAIPTTITIPATGSMRTTDATDVTKIINDIKGIVISPSATPQYKLAADVKDANCAADEVLYVVGDLTKGLVWQTPKDNVKLYNNTLFVVAKAATASGRLEVIWLDGSEENTTAIQAVKNVVEDGAIYNLAGQKVSASYKGVVIKNGKKMIQK